MIDADAVPHTREVPSDRLHCFCSKALSMTAATKLQQLQDSFTSSKFYPIAKASVNRYNITQLPNAAVIVNLVQRRAWKNRVDKQHPGREPARLILHRTRPLHQPCTTLQVLHALNA